LYTIAAFVFINFTTWDIYLVDLPFRTFINYSVLNSFNVFWTSVTYLVLFVSLLYLLLSQWYSNKLKLNYLTLISCLAMYLWSLSDLLTTNLNYLNASFITSDINLLLSNNLNKYHPYILYTSIFLLFIILLPNLTFLLNKYQTPYRTLNFNTLVSKCILWNLWALILGSWWALQEGTWGGWWNWDTSEVLGLIILVISLSLMHQTLKPYFFTWRSLANKLQLYLFTLFLFLLQLNFELTSHSFGSRIAYFFNNNFFLSEFSLILFLLINCTLFINLRQHTYFRISYLYIHILPKKMFIFYIIWSSWLVYGAVLSLVCSPLLNYYLWQLFELNLFNLTFNLKPLLILIGLLSLYYFIKSTGQLTYLVCILPTLVNYPFLIWILFLLLPLYNTYYLVHLYVIILIQLNFLSTLVDITLSNSVGTLLNNFLTTYGVINYHNYYSCLSNTISFSENLFNNTQLIPYSYNFFYKSNIPRLNNFTLIFNSNGLLNSYNVTGYFQLETCYFELTSLEPLFTLLITFLVTLTYLLIPSYKVCRFYY
jgi:hypothetical protein